MKDAYEILRKGVTLEPVDESHFYRLIRDFRRSYLDSQNYEERLLLHRCPNEFRGEVLRDLDSYLQKMHQREEMRDIHGNTAGYTSTSISEIWKADKRLKSLYNATKKYCEIRDRDCNIIAVHVAEYRALRKLFFSIQRSINKPYIQKKHAMGLWVQSLENVPAEAHRDYYIYLLDYGWSEPLADALIQNFAKMASLAAENRAVVIRGTHRVHFEDEVLSYHHINGADAEDLLPAILITNRNPHKFRHVYQPGDAGPVENDLRLILIPLKKFCNTTTEVVQLVERLFTDIKQQKALKDFRIAKEIIKDDRRAKADSIILAPDEGGQAIPMEEVVSYLNSGRSDTLNVEKIVLPIHFEDRSGNEFERLAFAFVNSYKSWDTLEWLGQTGDDDGRDIWGVTGGKTFCYQCANYRSLATKKVTDDIDKLVKEGAIPDCFIVICGGRVSVNSRTLIKNYAAQYGVKETEVWTGPEFEEKLRKYTPELIRRFVHGEEFPEQQIQEDKRIVKVLAECFDRPAFTTPFRQEVNIPDFEKAITDTIEVLNTGMHRLRDGTLIRKIPSRHEITDTQIKGQITSIYKTVVELRDKFISLKRDKEIQRCSCGQTDCPTYMLSENACRQMDEIRGKIFNQFKSINRSIILNFNDYERDGK